MAETAAEVEEQFRIDGFLEASKHGGVKRMKGDGEVKEAETTDARVWTNFPGFVALRIPKNRMSAMIEKDELLENIPQSQCER